MKVVINKTRNLNFPLSVPAMIEYGRLKGWNPTCYTLDAEGKTPLLRKGTSTSIRPYVTIWFAKSDLGDVIDAEARNTFEFYSSYQIERNDPDLITVVERLGFMADTQFSKLKIVEVPDDVEWVIQEDEDGTECVEEVARRWS